MAKETAEEILLCLVVYSTFLGHTDLNTLITGHGSQEMGKWPSLQLEQTKVTGVVGKCSVSGACFPLLELKSERRDQDYHEASLKFEREQNWDLKQLSPRHYDAGLVAMALSFGSRKGRGVGRGRVGALHCGTGCGHSGVMALGRPHKERSTSTKTKSMLCVCATCSSLLWALVSLTFGFPQR